MLPFVSRWSGNFSVRQEFPLFQSVTGFVGAQASIVGQRFGQLATASPPPARQVYPGYTQTNLDTGVKWGPWMAILFANNITDKRALLGGGVGDVPNNAFTIIPPRTLGLNLTRTF